MKAERVKRGILMPLGLLVAAIVIVGVCIVWATSRKHEQTSRANSASTTEFTPKDRALIELISDLVDVLDEAEKR